MSPFFIFIFLHISGHLFHKPRYIKQSQSSFVDTKSSLWHLHHAGHSSNQDADLARVSGPQPPAPDGERRAPGLGPPLGEDAAQYGVLDDGDARRRGGKTKDEMQGFTRERERKKKYNQ